MLPINHESPDATLCGDKEQTDHGPSVNFLVCQLETLTKFQCVESVNGNHGRSQVGARGCSCTPLEIICRFGYSWKVRSY